MENLSVYFIKFSIDIAISISLALSICVLFIFLMQLVNGAQFSIIIFFHLLESAAAFFGAVILAHTSTYAL